jgi:hypothetical protein
VPPITIWLHTLHNCPAPASPMRMTRSGLPIASRIGFTSSNAAASPPDHDGERRVDRADFAAADRRVEHRRAARPRRSASRRATAGEMLLMSMTIVPGWMAVRMPSGPSSTFSTSGESGSIVMMRVAWRATSAGEDARVAPAAASSSTGPGLRLCTRTA